MMRSVRSVPGQYHSSSFFNLNISNPRLVEAMMLNLPIKNNSKLTGFNMSGICF